MTFFAEGLSKLGIVNLHVRVEDSVPISRKLSTTAGSCEAIIHNEDTTSHVVLPLTPSKTEVFTPEITDGEFSVRIHATPSNTNGEATLLPAEMIQRTWDAGGKISCRNCHRQIIKSRTMHWKDLPSDSWLEFADYWLCHSPNSHSHSRTNTPTALLSAITAKSGLGLAGVIALLIHPLDMQNIEIQVHSPIPDLKDSALLHSEAGADTKVLE
jgi:hypothetical protein